MQYFKTLTYCKVISNYDKNWILEFNKLVYLWWT